VRLLDRLDKAIGLPVEVKEEEGTSRLWPAYRPNYSDGRVERPSGLAGIFAAYKEDPAVFTAIGALASAIADIPFVLIEAETDRTKGQFRSAREFYQASRSKTYAGITEKWASIEGGRVVRRHPILTMLQKPSPIAQLSGHMLKAAIVAYMELTGMAYIEKIYDAADNEKLVGLWPLIDPLKMQVVAGKQKLIDGYVWVGSTGMIVFKPEDMIYMRSFNPDNVFYGYSPTQVLKVIIAADLKALTWNYVFFNHGAIPAGILKSDQRITDPDVAAILDSWRDAHQHEENWHQPAVLGQGMSYQDIGTKHKDMDFNNLRRYSKEEILGAYGVPPIVAGDYKDANRASSDVMYRLFFEEGVLPRCDLIEDMLNLSLMDAGSGLRLVFDLGAIEALKGDVLEMAKVEARVKDTWTKNERRVFLWSLPVMVDDENRGNAIWDPKGENIIGYAPNPSEVVGGSNE